MRDNPNCHDGWHQEVKFSKFGFLDTLKNAFVKSLVFLTVLNRVSTRPGNPGNDLEFFSALKFVLEFYYFSVLSSKCSEIFFVQSIKSFFTVIISVFCLQQFILYFLSLCILTTSHVIIFSLFQKIIDMAKYNCIFDHDWLIEFEWVEKGPNARTAYCYPCHHTCDISSMGRSAVTSHSKGKKHKDNEISRKSLLILFFAKKKSCESCCVRFRSKGNVHLLHSHLQMCGIRSRVPCLVFSQLNIGVTEAEILWAIQTVLTHSSLYS